MLSLVPSAVGAYSDVMETNLEGWHEIKVLHGKIDLLLRNGTE